MDQLLEQPWDRIPSLDGLAEEISAIVDSLDVLYLGAGSDGVPLFAVSRIGQSGPAALVIGGGVGDSIVGLPAVASLLSELEPLPGFTTWVICGLDAPRIRHNDAQLGAISPSLLEHALSRRSAWGPGEDPEMGLPVDFARLWQPDQGEVGVSCSAEALALARALRRLKPGLVISLRDVPTGGAAVASSQDLLESDWKSLSEPLALVGMQHGPRFMPGHNVADQPGCLVLHSIEEEARRYTGGDSLAVGPVGSWQFQQSENPDSLYLALYLPRFTSPLLADGSPSEEKRSLEINHEVRLVRGREQNTRVMRLNRQGHPADGHEVRVEKVSDPEEPLGVINDQPVLSGVLAAEALIARRDVLRQALEAYQDALEHLEGEEAERGMQILIAAGDLDAEIKAVQTNRRFGEIASKADEVWWSEAYPYQTALLIQESLRCLKSENKADPRINNLKERLEELSHLQMEAVKNLKPLSAQDLAKLSFRWIGVAAGVAAAGGPALMRARSQVDRYKKQVGDARRAARAARHLRLPPDERSQADRELSQAEELLKEAEYELALAEMGVGDERPEVASPIEVEAQPASQEISETTDSITAEGPPKEEIATPEEAKANPEVPVDTGIEVPTSDEHDESAEPMKDSDAPGPPLPDPPPEATPVAPLPIPPEPPSIPSPDPEIRADDPGTWFIGPDHGRVELDEGLDIEPMLPDKLEIPAEWGRGPLRWKEQVPGRSQQPMLRRLARHLLGREPVESAGVQVEIDTPGQDIDVSTQRSVAVKEARSTGWLKRRVEPPHRYKAPPAELPNLPKGDGGRWRDFRRSVN